MNVTIEIADTDEPRLREMAKRCGYEKVEKFVSDYVAGLARRTGIEDLAPMSEEELQASLKMIDESMRQIDAGEGLTLEEAREALLSPLRDRAR